MAVKYLVIIAMEPRWFIYWLLWVQIVYFIYRILNSISKRNNCVPRGWIVDTSGWSMNERLTWQIIRLNTCCLVKRSSFSPILETEICGADYVVCHFQPIYISYDDCRWMWDIGRWMWDIGRWMWDIGRWMWDIGSWMWDIGRCARCWCTLPLLLFVHN